VTTPFQYASGSPRRLLVTGARGQLGASIVRAFADWDVVAHVRETLDVADPAAVRDVVATVAPSVIINCAAFNDVDGAESRPRDAFAANAFAVRSLARAADAAGATLVHYGTDFVFFDSPGGVPYTESSPPSPRSVYAASKLVGDWFGLEAARGYVLRVESLFGTPAGWPGRLGTMEKMVDALQAGAEVRAFADRIVSPSYVEDVAAATRHLLETGASPGLYHCVNSGRASWQAVAAEAARLLGVEPRIVPVRVDDVRMTAPRPRFCALDNGKLAAAGFPMPPWQDALRRWLSARRFTAAPPGSVE
jgi:dTDP-4-dehydrorhamnose reductase